MKLKRTGYPDLLVSVDSLSGNTVVCTADLFGLAPGNWKVTAELNGQSAEASSDTEV